MVADMGEPQRPGIIDQQPEDAAARGEVPDRAVRLGVDPRRDEAPEALAAVVEDADGRVAGPGDLARDVQKLLQDGVDLELGDQGAPCVNQAPKTGLVENWRGQEAGLGSLRGMSLRETTDAG